MESSSQSQATEDSATGVVQGSRMRKRTIHLPRKSAARISASSPPSTTMSSSEMPVNHSVFHSEVQNTGSWKISSKFLKPTHSKLESPVVTSLNANAIARANGMPTSAMM